ncbi:HNH endonuclease [Leucobacter allii]|uniref:HNH endonuclease n=1 Tax=Leucobacter allii TaxID=2932247 RepID=A0ABY4FHX7_9MICO|nr:HNH endonuclease signature motif containing protein [Leucobacter allii]UOQ56274.1 HNH endonuclease [Leucobacter allii]
MDPNPELDLRTAIPAGLSEGCAVVDPEDPPAGDVAGAPGFRLAIASFDAAMSDLPESPSDDELLAAVAEVESLSRRVEAAQVRLAHLVRAASAPGLGAESLARRRGCRGTIELLQHTTAASARTLSRRLRVADRVAPRLGIIGERLDPVNECAARAFAEGRLSLECTDLVTGVLARTELAADPEHLAVAEREMVAAATGDGGELPLHDDSMRTVARVWGSFLDQDGESPGETVAELKRGLRFGRERRGLVPLHGALLAETAALLGRLCDAINAPQASRRPRFAPVEAASPTAGTGAEPGEAAHGGTAERRDDAVLDADALTPTDPRTADQRRHDALATLLAAAAKQAETPQLGGAPVTVLVQVTAEELSSGDGAGWVHGPDGAPLPVPISTVRHAACAGAVQRVTQDTTGRIIGLDSPQRIFSAHQRRAITVRDGGCVIPGCTVAAAWCEVHHVAEHAAGGPTHTDNGVLLCWHHHRSLGSSGWEVRMHDGIPEVRPPYWTDPRRRWHRVRSPLRPPGLARSA